MVFQSITAPDSAFVWNTHQYPRHRLADPNPGQRTPKLLADDTFGFLDPTSSLARIIFTRVRQREGEDRRPLAGAQELRKELRQPGPQRRSPS